MRVHSVHFSCIWICNSDWPIWNLNIETLKCVKEFFWRSQMILTLSLTLARNHIIRRTRSTAAREKNRIACKSNVWMCWWIYEARSSYICMHLRMHFRLRSRKRRYHSSSLLFFFLCVLSRVCRRKQKPCWVNYTVDVMHWAYSTP